MSTGKSKFNAQCALVSGLLVLLSACSSDDGDDSDLTVLQGLAVTGLGGRSADEVLSPWLASIQTFRLDSRTPGTGDARIATIQYNDSITLQSHIDWYSGLLELDTCEIDTGEDTSSGGGDDDDDSSGVPYVSAGESVVINASNGNWYTIDQGDTGFYEVDNTLPGAFPAGASLSIPGAVSFPSVASIPIIEPAAPVRISPQTDDVSVESEYRWQAAGGPGVSIRLAFLEYDAAGDFVDFRGGCDLIDDGEFELPADALVAISNNSNRLEARYTRDRRSLSVQDGIVAYSRISVAE